jgi:hypothetical protein
MLNTLLALILLVLVAVIAYRTLLARSGATKAFVADNMDTVQHAITGRPSFDELLEAWTPIVTVDDVRQDLVKARPDLAPIFRLYHSNDDDVAKLRQVVERYVNCVNPGICEPLDEGIISLEYFLRRYPETHRQLLEELPLVVPFVWFEVLVRRRGRWGYRVAQLYELVKRLRECSDMTPLHGHMTIAVNGYPFANYPRVTPIRQAYRGVKEFDSPCRISRRTKLIQQQKVKLMRDDLRDLGVSVPSPDTILSSVVW